MVVFTFPVRTRKGLRKVTIRFYSRSAPLLVNPNDGRNLDRTADIAEAYRGDRDGEEAYFREKEASIRRDYREDSNSAAAEGESASELHGWQQDRDDLIDQLNEQRDDVFDLGLADSSSDSDGDIDSDGDSISGNNNLLPSNNNGDSVSGNTNLSPSNNNASSPNNDVTGALDPNTVGSNSNNTSYHAQDSSDVVQTDFSSFDPFEE